MKECLAILALIAPFVVFFGVLYLVINWNTERSIARSKHEYAMYVERCQALGALPSPRPSGDFRLADHKAELREMLHRQMEREDTQRSALAHPPGVPIPGKPKFPANRTFQEAGCMIYIVLMFAIAYIPVKYALAYIGLYSLR